jgi:putative acetyltransferase
MITYTIQLVTQPTPLQLDRIMAIWLQGNLQAHDFIPSGLLDWKCAAGA